MLDGLDGIWMESNSSTSTKYKHIIQLQQMQPTELPNI